MTDEGHLLRAHVSATNADGGASAHSPATAAVAATPPQSTTAPTLTGQAARAQVLTANPGVWSGPDNTYTYAWQRSTDSGNTWTAISGASATTYTLTQADEGAVVRFSVTASNPDQPGGDTAASGPTQPVAAAPPVNSTLPVVSGTPQRLQTLTASTGTWNGPSLTVTTQWQRSTDGAAWTSISGATKAAYTVTQADEGAYLRMLVTASNLDLPGGVTAASVATSAVQSAPPQNTLPPTVARSGRLGAQLTAGGGAWTPQDATLAYQWQHDCGSGFTNISGATSVTYTLDVGDEGGPSGSASAPRTSTFRPASARRARRHCPSPSRPGTSPRRTPERNAA